MIGSEWKVNRKYLRRLKILVVILSFVGTLHIARHEGARFSDNSLNDKDLAFSAPMASSTIGGSENFQATAYCISGITKSGARVAPGHVAADPKVIPLGSVIYVDSPIMGGIYQVLDTGSLVKGKIIDIFIPSYEDCIEFGRRAVKVHVLRYGFFGHDRMNELPR